MVMLGHLVGGASLAHYGYYAVRGFFVLSGFLMTAGLHEVYRFDGRRYFANRALRLLPQYYIVCLLTLGVILLAPDSAAQFIQQWTPDLLWRDAVTNLILLPVHHPEPHYRLVPNVWSIAVEMQLYILLFVFVARSERNAVIGLCAGALYHGICSYNGLDFSYRYFGALAACLSYSLGALAWFWIRRGELRVGPRAGLIALAAWLANLLTANSILAQDYVYKLGYYVGIGMFIVVVAGLSQVKASPALKRLDTALGELSYPFFLLHWLVGFLTWRLLMPDTVRGWPLFWAALGPTLGAAAVLAIASHKLLDPLRLRIRQSTASRNEPEVAAGSPVPQSAS
jgi:peptidoglycan/LPS O-acetylase OafA/YrhL